MQKAFHSTLLQQQLGVEALVPFILHVVLF